MPVLLVTIITEAYVPGKVEILIGEFRTRAEDKGSRGELT
jgi:hypothetical protein